MFCCSSGAARGKQLRSFSGKTAACCKRKAAILRWWECVKQRSYRLENPEQSAEKKETSTILAHTAADAIFLSEQPFQIRAGEWSITQIKILITAILNRPGIVSVLQDFVYISSASNNCLHIHIKIFACNVFLPSEFNDLFLFLWLDPVKNGHERWNMLLLTLCSKY